MNNKIKHILFKLWGMSDKTSCFPVSKELETQSDTVLIVVGTILTKKREMGNKIHNKCKLNIKLQTINQTSKASHHQNNNNFQEKNLKS